MGGGGHEVHDAGAEDVPAAGTVLHDHSRLHAAHIDHIETLRILNQDVGECLVAVVREGLQGSVF